MARRMASEGRGLTRRQAAVGLAVLPLAACQPPPQTTATPPETSRQPAVPGALLELTELDPSIRLDIRYATANNFTGRILYEQARAFLVTAAAQAIVRASVAAKADGYGLLIHDAYRPWSVTKKLWDATPPAKRGFVADPKQGSRHNRGCAVDLTLYDRKTGKALEMPSGYDEFSPRAYRSYDGGSLVAVQNRARLERYMEAEDFIGISNEWWHFDYKDWANYPILDVAFSEL
jgi:zinc D-Ala-D-Ala dipeptidase